MAKNKATIIGFIAAPAVPVIVGDAIAWIAPGVQASPNDFYDVLLSIGMGLVVYVYACMLTVLLGVPAYLFCKKYGMVRWWSATLVGGIVGAIFESVLLLPNLPGTENILMQSSIGALSGFLFWSIWRLGKQHAKSHGEAKE